MGNEKPVKLASVDPKESAKGIRPRAKSAVETLERLSRKARADDFWSYFRRLRRP